MLGTQKLNLETRVKKTIFKCGSYLPMLALLRDLKRNDITINNLVHKTSIIEIAYNSNLDDKMQTKIMKGIKTGRIVEFYSYIDQEDDDSSE